MAATSSTEAFELNVSVLPADIDELGHVNNTVYLRWVQDAATAHWQAVASAGDQAAIFWVVMRHEIDYKAPAFAADEVLLRTWVGTASRLTFERHTEICMRERSPAARAGAHALVPDQQRDRQASRGVSADVRSDSPRERSS